MSARNFFHADHKRVRSLILQNTFWLGASEAISRGLWLLLLILAARIFPPTDFGKLAIAFSFVSLVAIVADFGLTHIGIREFSQETGNEDDFSSFFSLRILFFLISFFLIVLGSIILISDVETRMLIWFFGIFSLAREFPKSVFTLLRARQTMHFEAILRSSQAIVIGGAAFFALLMAEDLLVLAKVAAISSAATSIGILFWFFLRVHPFKLSLDKRAWKKFLLPSLWVGVAMVSAGVYIHIDTVMLGMWRGEHEAGIYSAAYRIAGIPMLLLTFFSMGFYPALGKAFSQSKENFQAILRFRWYVTLVSVIPIGIGGVMFALPLMELFYGKEYSVGAPVLQMLFVMVVFAFLENIFSMTFLIARKEHLYTFAAGVVALVNIMLNIILIPRFGMMGAAVSTVLAYMVLLGLQAFLSLRLGVFGKVVWHADAWRLGIVLLCAGGVMTGGIFIGFAEGLNPLMVGLIASIGYYGLILICWKKRWFQFL